MSNSFGYPSDAVPTHLISGGTPARDGVSNGWVQAGGVAFVGDDPLAECGHTSKRTGAPCTAHPIQGTNHCVGHARVAKAHEDIHKEA
jgi:hypothetical protein